MAPGWTSCASCAAGSPTPGIAVSGFGSADDVAQSLESGFALHLVKPIDVRALAAAIASVTAKHAVKAPPRGCSRESSSQLAPVRSPLER